jgi:hypothetical protein
MECFASGDPSQVLGNSEVKWIAQASLRARCVAKFVSGCWRFAPQGLTLRRDFARFCAMGTIFVLLRASAVSIFLPGG